MTCFLSVNPNIQKPNNLIIFYCYELNRILVRFFSKLILVTAHIIKERRKEITQSFCINPTFLISRVIGLYFHFWPLT